MLDLAGDDHHRRGEMNIDPGVVLERLLQPAALFDAGQLEQEVGVEEGAAELAVGDRLEAEVFLVFRDLADRFVLNAAQHGMLDPPFRERGARFDQLLGSQETADVVGA